MYKILAQHGHITFCLLVVFSLSSLLLRIHSFVAILTFVLLLGMYRISGSGSGLPDIRSFFSNPVPVPVAAKMVSGNGYLSRIVFGPFWQFALPGESLLNIEHCTTAPWYAEKLIFLKYKLFEVLAWLSRNKAKCNCVQDYWVDWTFLVVFLIFDSCWITVNCDGFVELQISGSGRIVRLISGAFRFRPDVKNCYPVHPQLLLLAQ